MQAIMATLKALPAAMRRSPNGWMIGLQRMAEIVAMYKPARTAARPPKMVRWPRMVPESRFMGATPTRAAICWGLSFPSSGRSATSWLAVLPRTMGGISTDWAQAEIAAKAEGSIELPLKLPADVRPGRYVVAVDLRYHLWDFPQITEAILLV